MKLFCESRALFVIAQLLLLTQLTTAEPSPQGRKMLYYQQKLPMFYDSNINGYPDGTDYHTDRLMPLSLIFFGFAFIGFMCCCCCITCRSGANSRCGACKGRCCDFFCATGNPAKEGYEASFRRNTFIVFFVLIILMVACAVLTSIGLMKLADGGGTLVDDTQLTTATLNAVTLQATTSMTDLGLAVDTASYVSDINSVLDKVNDITGKYDDNQAWVQGVGYTVIGLLVLIPCVVGARAYGALNGSLATCLAVFSFVFLIIIWCVGGLTMYAGQFSDDTCVQLQLWYSCKTTTFRGQAACSSNKLHIDDWLKCPDASLFLPGYQASYDKAESLIQTWKTTYTPTPGYNFTLPNAACTTADTSTCVSRTPGADYTTADYAHVDAWRMQQYDAVKDAYPQCDRTARQLTSYYLDASCITSCTSSLNPAVGAACNAKAILTAADALSSLSYDMSCSYLTILAGVTTASIPWSMLYYGATAPDKHSCQNFVEGFIYIFSSCAAWGTLYFFLLFILIFAWKWWGAEHQEDYYDDKDAAIQNYGNVHQLAPVPQGVNIRDGPGPELTPAPFYNTQHMEEERACC